MNFGIGLVCRIVYHVPLCLPPAMYHCPGPQLASGTLCLLSLPCQPLSGYVQCVCVLFEYCEAECCSIIIRAKLLLKIETCNCILALGPIVSVEHTWAYTQWRNSKFFFQPEHEPEPLPFAATILDYIITACVNGSGMLIVCNPPMLLFTKINWLLRTDIHVLNT